MSVFKKVKHLFQHSVIYSLANILAKATGFVLLPFLTDTSLIPIEDNSTYGFFIMTTVLFTNFVSLGMESTIVKFLKLEPEKSKHIVNNAVIAVIGSSIVVIGATFLFQDLIATFLLYDPLKADLVICIGLVASFDTLANLPNYYFRADEKPKTFVYYKFLRFIVEVSCIILALKFFKLGVNGAVYGLLTASIFNVFILLPFYIKHFRPNLDLSLLKKMLSFGLPLLPNAVLYLMVEMTDRHFLENLVNKETQTIYTNIYKFGAILTIVNSSFRSAWQPIMLREVKENDNRQFFAKVMTYFVVFSSLIMVFVSLLALDFIQYNPIPQIQSIISDPIYFTEKHILPFILFGYVFLGIYYNLSLAYFATNQSIKFMIFTFSGVVVNLAVNCLMFSFPEHGTTLAALATFLSFFTMAALSYFKSKKLFPVEYETRKLLIMFVYMAIVVLVGTFTDLGFIWKCILAISYLPYLVVTKVIQFNEINQIKRLVRRG